MRKLLISGLLVLFSFVCWSIDFQSIDDLHDKGKYEEEFKLLSDVLTENPAGSDAAETYWRISRVILEITGIMDRNGEDKDKILAAYTEGITAATKGIEADSNSYLSYFWRSANTGKWGQKKGILDSLDKAKPMRDDLEKAININPRHGESWKVLGMLYSQVPGIISFGDKDAAVSLGRKSVDSREAADDFDNHFELAKLLAARDWSASKRNKSLKKKKREFDKESNLLDKHFYYEGIIDFDDEPSYSDIPLKDLSDTEEAFALLIWVKSQINRLPNKQDADYRLLEDVEVELETLE